jgi:hypothetical protein
MYSNEKVKNGVQKENPGDHHHFLAVLAGVFS